MPDSPTTPPDAAPEPAAPQQQPETFTDPSAARAAYGGRGSLIVAGLTLALALYITVGLFTMDVPESSQPPGPKFYPLILAVVTYALCAILVINVIRKPEAPETVAIQIAADPTTVDADPESAAPAPTTREVAFRGDWKAVVIAVASFLVFTLILVPVGWIISAALMFGVMSWALGSKRPVLDLAIGLVVSSAVQVAFSMGLSLNLPAGVLGGIF
ncbi:MAG: tripartite tricarboxylate transporter TctB family protein [Micrococcaceae bacterium]